MGFWGFGVLGFWGFGVLWLYFDKFDTLITNMCLVFILDFWFGRYGVVKSLKRGHSGLDELDFSFNFYEFQLKLIRLSTF